jgi:hypothetical protein
MVDIISHKIGLFITTCGRTSDLDRLDVISQKVELFITTCGRT